MLRSRRDRLPRTCVSALLAAFSLTALSVFAEEFSTLSLPVSAGLSGLSGLLERSLPRSVVDDTRHQTCIEPERACTKIPEFRGFKIYSRMECIEVTPRIDCSIEQKVDRIGPVVLGGTGGTLSVQQRFEGVATVRGRGAIGRHIQETASGSAMLSLSVTPRITPDWRLEADVGHRLDWTSPPTARLFGIFPVTFQGDATAALDAAVERFKAEELPGELARLDLRAAIEPLWADLQAPVPVTMPNGSNLFLAFSPSTVALAPLRIRDDAVSTRLSLAGRWRLTDEAFAADTLTPLPSLLSDPPPAGLAVTLPVELGLGTLSELVASELPMRFEFSRPVSGTLELRSVEFGETADHALVASLETTVTALGIGPVSAPLALVGQPEWDPDLEELGLRSPRTRIDAGPVASRLLDSILSHPGVVDRIAQATRVSLAEQIDMVEAALSDALDRDVGRGVRSAGEVQVVVSELVLNDGLRLTVRVDGHVELSAFELH